MLIGPINFSDLKITLSEAVFAATDDRKGRRHSQHGTFIQLIIDFR